MRRRIVISSLEILNQKLNLRLPLKVRGVVIVIWGDGELSSLRLTFLIKFCTALCVCVCMCVCVCVCVLIMSLSVQSNLFLRNLPTETV